MTYSNTYNSFTLANANDSYAWATESWDESAFVSMTLEECAEAARKEAKIQLSLAIENIEADFLESEEYNEDGEPLVRNRTLEEVVAELTEDVPHLETHLYRWMVEAGEDTQDDPTEGGSEPLYTITHEMMGEWDEPATVAEIAETVATWATRGAEYAVQVDLDKVYAYVELDELNVSDEDADGDYWVIDSDFRPSSDAWVQLDDRGTSYRLEIGELYQPEEPEEPEEDDEPQPFNVETAARLVTELFVTETDGIHIARGKVHCGHYDISKDAEDRHLYEVVWVDGINASHEIKTQAELIVLLVEEAQLGAKFFWQVMENNDWELTKPPYLQTYAGYLEDIREGVTPQSSYFDAYHAERVAESEAYEAEFAAMDLGESTLAKIRRQKELLLEDRENAPTPSQEGFEVVYGGWVNAEGGIDNPRVVVFADRQSFDAQNPNHKMLIDEASHRQEFPYIIMGDIYLFDRPEGGYEIYPRDGRTREDGSVAEIW